MERKPGSVSDPADRKPLSVRQMPAQSNAGVVNNFLANSGAHLYDNKENVPQQPNTIVSSTFVNNYNPGKTEQLKPRLAPVDREELRKKVEVVVALHLAKRAEQDRVKPTATDTIRSVGSKKETVSLRRETTMRNILSSLLVLLVVAWSAARVVLQDRGQPLKMQRPEKHLDIVSVTELLPIEVDGESMAQPLELHQVTVSLSSPDEYEYAPFVPEEQALREEAPLWHNHHSVSENGDSAVAAEDAADDTAQPEVHSESADGMAELAKVAPSNPAVRTAGQQLQLSLGKLRALIINPLNAAIQRAKAVALRWWERAVNSFRRQK